LHDKEKDFLFFSSLPGQAGAHGRTSMKKAKKRKKQQGCKITEIIDAIEKTASMAMKIYNRVEPIIRAILTNGRRTK
jgi:hypothetical protein